jgi:outer membrane protein OmpA-like peptidoglycan-associated protein
MESLTLQELAREDGAPHRLRTTVAEVFFPLDEASLNEEARLVLDYVALHLNRHPELFAEIRGFANDIGDETTNMLLAKRRAERVLEYFIRRQMDNYRLTAVGMPQDVEGVNLSNDPRRGRRVDVVLYSAER